MDPSSVIHTKVNMETSENTLEVITSSTSTSTLTSSSSPAPPSLQTEGQSQREPTPLTLAPASTPSVTSPAEDKDKDKTSPTSSDPASKPKHQHVYPPFPAPPPNSSSILPFSKFKEHGIQVFGDPETGVELDGLGIPTVRLRIGHITDTRKTGGKVGGYVGERLGGGGREGEGGGVEGGGEDGDGEGPESERVGGGSAAVRRRRKKKKKLAEAAAAEGKVVDPNPTTQNRNQKNVKLPVDLSTIKDPLERALEEKKQRLMLFSNQEWWEQWAAGEDLRRGRTYDSSTTPVDRVHMASTDFRKGRIWPPASSNVRFLWDQFRLYVGLLGSPPVWKRMDIPTSRNVNSDPNNIHVKPRRKTRIPAADRKEEDESSEDDILHTKYSDEEEEEKQEQEDEGNGKSSTTANKPKRVPPRAPYGLFPPPPPQANFNEATNTMDEDDENNDNEEETSRLGDSYMSPILITSEAQVTLLLSLASTLRQTRLLNFLAEPATFVAEFLSSYTYTQGLVWGSPTRMVGIGRLVIFWLEFMKRCGVLSGLNLGSRSSAGVGSGSGSGSGGREGRYRESLEERELVKAIGIAQRAVVEIPRAAWVVRMSSEEKGGKGCRALWGPRWKDEGMYAFGDDPANNFENFGLGGSKVEEEEEEKEEEDDMDTKLRKFEEQLRAENIELFTADPVELGLPPLHRERTDNDAEPIVIEKKEDVNSKEEKTGPNDHSDDVTRLSLLPPLPPPPVPVDWSRPYDNEDNQGKEPVISPWLTPPEQTLFNFLGSMSAFPLLHTAGGWDARVGCAERSVRRIKAICAPGVGSAYGLDGDAGKKTTPTAMEESLMGVFTRVVLEPWNDWDDMDMAIDYQTPKVCGPKEMRAVEKDVRDEIHTEEKEKEKTKQHEKEDNDIADPAEEQDPIESQAELERRIARRLERIENDRKRFAHTADTDEITLLVEPRLAEGMSVGMGILGTWVQIVPVAPRLSPFASGSGASVSGRGGARGRGRRRGRGRGRGGGGGGGPTDQPPPPPKRERTFWYIEEMHMAVPSFWAVPKKGVSGWSFLAEPEELRKMFFEAVEAGEDVLGVDMEVEEDVYGI